MYKKVVILGGGSGSSSLLKGLKEFPIDITAVITVADNGRSTGVLRKEFDIPAVGDIRKVITNLSNIDPVMKATMEYRFHTSSDLNGHALGNLILTALMDITGNLKDSIAALSTLLDVRHKVLPISEESNITLMGETMGGTIIEGEAAITAARQEYRRIFYKQEPKVVKEVIEAIMEADLIIISMGSLFTSILPHIICKEVQQAMKESKAPVMYLCNAMTQPGETDHYGVSDHLKLLNHYLDGNYIDVVVASNTQIDPDIAKKYETEEQKDPVYIDEKEIEQMGIELLQDDLVTVVDGMLRHDSMKLSSIIFSYLMRS